MTKCECADPKCAVHAKESICPNEGSLFLYRVDMVDNCGLFFCDECAQDALESGLFAVKELDEGEER